MPQIFSEESREKVRNQLLGYGYMSIKTYGLKKTSISEVAHNCGISTGTFYNFFKSKEEFVYQIMLSKRQHVKDEFGKLIANGPVSREVFRKFMEETWFGDIDLFDYLNDKEIAMLRSQWPEEYWKDGSRDSLTSETILSHLDGGNPNCDWKTFSNLCKCVSLIRNGRSRLYEENYAETLSLVIEMILDYLYV